MKTWTSFLQDNYSAFEEWESYSEMFGLAERIGFSDAREAWEANPFIGGSVNASDFGLAINPSALYWASFNRFEFRIPGQCVLDCSHSGSCGEDVEYWTPKIEAQILADNFPNRPDAESIRAELKEYGSWDTEELADDAANMRRIVWIAAGNINEDKMPDCSAPIQSAKQ